MRRTAYGNVKLQKEEFKMYHHQGSHGYTTLIQSVHILFSLAFTNIYKTGSVHIGSFSERQADLVLLIVSLFLTVQLNRLYVG